MRPRRWLTWGLGGLAALLVAGRAWSALVVERAWLAALGVPGLFAERWVDQLLLQGGAWVAGTLFAFANLHAVRRTILAVAVPARVANLELTAMIPGRRLLAVTVALAAGVGALLAAPMDHWPLVAMARRGLPFGEIEGILGRDLGFYVYWLPLEEALYLWALVTVVTVAAMVVVLYALTRSLRMEGRRIAASTHVRRHLSVLGALVLLLLGWSYRLDAFDLLAAGSAPDGGFSAVDHRVTLRIDTVLAMASVAAALIVARAGWVGQLRVALGALTVVLVAAVGLRQGVPLVRARQQARVPDADAADYRTMRALFTRRAFGVAGIRHVAAGAGSPDAPEAPHVREDQLPDAVAWPGLAGTLGRQVAGDRESTVAPVVGWQAVGGTLGAVVAMPPQAPADRWRMRRVAWARLGAASPSGVAALGDTVLVAPEASGHLVVEDPAVPGVSLGSGGARLAAAWALRDPSLLRRPGATASAVVVLHRDVRDRVRRLAPVFAQGRELSPVLVRGRPAWTLALYAVSDRFPLSQRWLLGNDAVSYAHFAATAVVDAATGTVQLVPAPRLDPVARSWLALVRPLVVPVVPGDAWAMLPPASDAAMLQLRTLSEYGAAGVRAGQLRVPDSAFVGGGPPAQVLRTRDGPVVGWSVPLLDAAGRMAGVASVTGGAARRTWRTTLPSPGVSWDSAGRLLASALESAGVPGDSVAVGGLRPLVVTGDRGVLIAAVAPTGTGVAVTDGARVGAAPAFADAMRVLRPGDARWSRPVERDTPTPSLDEAGRQVERMRAAMRRGDWAAFGAAFDSLARAVGRPPPR
jgi:hypothetical protein